MKKTQKKATYDIIGYSLAAIGIISLFFVDTVNHLIFAGMLSLIGSIVIGGLPKIKNLKKIFQVNLVFLIIGITALIIYWRVFGTALSVRNILGDIIAWFFIGVFVINAFKLIGDDKK